MHLSTKYSIAVHCLIFIHEYGGQKKVTSELLALSTGSNPVTIRNIISSLRKEGIISVKFGTGGAAISCPLEDISLYQPTLILSAFGTRPAPSPFCPVGRNIHNVLDTSYGKIRSDLCRSLQSITLEQIIDEYHNIL